MNNLNLMFLELSFIVFLPQSSLRPAPGQIAPQSWKQHWSEAILYSWPFKFSKHVIKNPEKGFRYSIRRSLDHNCEYNHGTWGQTTYPLLPQNLRDTNRIRIRSL